MVAVEKYITKDKSLVIEIEREDNEDWIWIYRNKIDYENQVFYRGGRIIKETDKKIIYRQNRTLTNKAKESTVYKCNFLGYASNKIR